MNKSKHQRTQTDLFRRDGARQRVLQALRHSGPAHRADLGRLTGFSPASISSIVGVLLREAVLIEQDEPDAATGPGRPGIRVGFNPSRGAAVGLWVGLDVIVLQGVDLAGQLVASRTKPVALARASGTEITAILAEACRRFIESDMAGSRVLTLGIAFQGLIDQQAGSVVWSPVIAARDLPLAEGLRLALQLPVFIENDASAMAYAICRHRRAFQTGFTACVMIGDGVGLGLLRDGKLLRGARGGGSEFGHVQLDPAGPQCRCGARGCIESYGADYALFRDAVTISEAPAQGHLRPGEVDMAAITARAHAGDPALRQLFDGAGRALGRGIVMLVQLFQPDHVVLCGPGVRAHGLLEPALLAEIDRGALAPLRRNLKFTPIDFTSVQLTEGVVLQSLEAIDAELAAAGIQAAP